MQQTKKSFFSLFCISITFNPKRYILINLNNKSREKNKIVGRTVYKPILNTLLSVIPYKYPLITSDVNIGYHTAQISARSQWGTYYNQSTWESLQGRARYPQIASTHPQTPTHRRWNATFEYSFHSSPPNTTGFPRVSGSYRTRCRWPRRSRGWA